MQNLKNQETEAIQNGRPLPIIFALGPEAERFAAALPHAVVWEPGALPQLDIRILLAHMSAKGEPPEMSTRPESFNISPQTCRDSLRANTAT